MSTPRACAQNLAGQRVDLDDALDLVAKELDAHRQVLIRWEDLQHIAAHAELAAREVLVVALILDVGQLAQHAVAAALSPTLRVNTTSPYSSGDPRP